MGLAALFSRILIHYDNPATTQSIAFSKFCPAATIECGQPGNQAGIARATDFVFDVLHAQELPRTQPHGGDVDIYRTVGRVEVDPNASFAFGAAGDADIVFPAELDHLNFTDLDAGASIARISSPNAGLRVFDDENRDVSDVFLRREASVVRLKRPATPAMLSTNAKIVRQDCLGYLMERVDNKGPRSP